MRELRRGTEGEGVVVGRVLSRLCLTRSLGWDHDLS